MTLEELREKLPSMTERQKYLFCRELERVFLASYPMWDKDYMLIPVFSLPSEIREAYLRAVGRWEDEA